MPTLHFKFDRTTERAAELNALIAKANATRAEGRLSRDTTRAAARPGSQRRPVHGVLLLDKPLGLSSNDALQQAKRLLRAEKAGHTGTLDPLATRPAAAVLRRGDQVRAGSASTPTRPTEATLRLGVTTTTGDAEGEVVARRGRSRVDRADARARVRRSSSARSARCRRCTRALKHDGKPLYEYARAGIEVEREARDVAHPRSIRVVDGADDRWTIDVRCSKGTYIRTLGEDIGEALGCGAHLAALRRIAQRRASTSRGASRSRRSRRWRRRSARRLPAAARRAARRLATRVALDDGRCRRASSPASGAGATLRRRAAAWRVYGPEPGAFLGTAHVSGRRADRRRAC